MGISELLILIPAISLTLSSPQVDTVIDESVDSYYGYYVEIVEEEKAREKAEEERILQETISYVEEAKFNEKGLVLMEGVASEEVYRLKNFLKTMGYAGISENYYFDSNLKKAVVDYQGKNGLSADGIVGAGTYRSINNDLKTHRIILPQMKIKINGNVPSGNWIMINKNNNTLYYLKGSSLVKKYPVATGRTMDLTPEGKYVIVNKLVNPGWGGAGKYDPVPGGAPNNPLGKRWMGINIGGGGTYGIHGNSNSSSVGKYVSAGCVRMHNPDVESFFNQVSMRTPVWIGSEEKLSSYGITFNME